MIDFLTVSSASLRWHSIWKLPNRMLACGARWVFELRNAFHMSITTGRIVPALFRETARRRPGELIDRRPNYDNNTLLRVWLAQ